MDLIEFNWEPIAWKRPGRCGNLYFDIQTKEKKLYAFHAKKFIKNDYRECSCFFLEIVYEMPMPSSLSKAKRLELNLTPHNKKPDLDNLTKFILDALKGVIWDDDRLISIIKCKKIYSLDPKTILFIKEI